MAWSVVIFALPVEFKSMEDVPEDFEPVPLGSKTHIHAVLMEAFPDVEFTASSYADLDRPDFHIEISLDQGDVVESIGLRVHGADSVIEAIQKLCEHTGWRAYDTSVGELIDFQHDPAKGLRGWRNYADKVIGPDRNPKGYRIGTQTAEPPGDNV